jgi:hypothetical protein
MLKPDNSAFRRRPLAAIAATGLLSLCSIVGVTALTPAVAYADNYTSVDLNGRIVDQKGAPIAGATIAVESDQGTVRQATADQNGEFRMPAMPSGAYTATVSASGFNSLSNQAIALSSGGSKLEFTIVRTGEMLEEVLVSAVRVVKDFNKTDGGLVLDVQDLAERVAIGRSINSAVMLTPTVSIADPSIAANGVRRNQSAVSVSGTSAAESVYYINGLNVTDQRTFLGYSDLPFEMIKSVETKTGGYQAEFGRGTGGVVNIVTRSGSNDFHYGVSAFTTPNSLRGSRTTTYAPGGNNSVGILDKQQTVESNFSEQTLWASGPIMRDHIFFFGLVNPRSTDNWNAARFTTPTTNNGTWLNTKYNDPRWAAKLDFVLNENHRVEATVFSDKENTSYRPWNYGRSQNGILAVAGLTNSDGSLLPYQQEAGGVNSILQYTGVISPHFTISALGGRSTSNYQDSGPYIATPGVVDFATTGGHVTLGRQAGPFNLEGEDTRDTIRLDADIYFNMAGDHHLRVGYDNEDLVSSAVSAYTGGALYYGYDQADCPAGAGAAGCVEKLTFANVGDYKATQSAWYAQDSWAIRPNFSLQLGVRADLYDYKNVTGQSYIKITDQIAPRLGFSWDPSGAGVNRFYGSFGDYYLPIATNTSIRASSGEIYTDQYYQTARDGAGNLVISPTGYPTLGAQLGPTDYFSPPGAPDPRSVIQEGLKPMYEREWTLGFEHEFNEGRFSGWRAGARYVHRNLQSTIEDTAIGDAIQRYCLRVAIVACTPANPNFDVAAYPYILVNPGRGARVFLDLEADSRTIGTAANPAYNPQFINLTAADLALSETNRTYDAVELTFERPFDGKWSMQGSYTWARSKGNYEGAVKSDIGQTDTSITQDFDHAANGLNAAGNLPNDRRHTLKLYGSWAPINRLTIGSNLIVQSGRPYSCIGYVPASADSLAPNSGTPSGFFCPRGAALANATGALATQMTALGLTAQRYASVATPRGASGTTDWLYQVDLNLAYKFFQSDVRGEATVNLDIFNVFDGTAVTRIVEQGEVRTSAGAVKNVAAPFYGLPRTYQGARSVRLGVRYSF